MPPKAKTEAAARPGPAASAAAGDGSSASPAASKTAGDGNSLCIKVGVGVVLLIIGGVVYFNYLPSVETGKPCIHNDQCADDAECVMKDSQNEEAGDVCKAFIGGKCTKTTDCNERLPQFNSIERVNRVVKEDYVYRFVFKQLPRGTNDYAQTECLDGTCQVFAGKDPNECWSIAIAVDKPSGDSSVKLCMAKPDEKCDSHRGNKPMQWCAAGSCQRAADRWGGESWLCKAKCGAGGDDCPPGLACISSSLKRLPAGSAEEGTCKVRCGLANGSSCRHGMQCFNDMGAKVGAWEKDETGVCLPEETSAAIQLAETADAWRASNTSHRAISHNLRKKKSPVQSSALQVDSA